MSDRGRLDYTIAELRELFERRNNGGEEPREWEATFRLSFEKWRTGTSLSEPEIRFLANSLTELIDTPDSLFRAAADSGLDQFLYCEIQQLQQEILRASRDSVREAWKDLEKAFERQFAEAEQARSQGGTGNMRTEFCEALKRLNRAVKEHSGTPRHRPRGDPERELAIDRMRNQGQAYVDIANQLRHENPRWKITPQGAERLHKRYLERVHNLLHYSFREMFKNPPANKTT